VLGVTVVVAALPSMLTSLHASQAYSTLVATGYAMFFGGLLTLGAPPPRPRCRPPCGC